MPLANQPALALQSCPRENCGACTNVQCGCQKGTEVNNGDSRIGRTAEWWSCRSIGINLYAEQPKKSYVEIEPRRLGERERRQPVTTE